MNFFYIPIIYTFKTRLKNLVSLFSWFIICPLLLFILLITKEQGSITLSIIICYILSFIHTYNLYEIGYIINDTETIKKESKPTLRLSDSKLSFYYKKRLSIYLERIILSLFISIILIYYYNTPLIAISYSWLLIPFYLIYNNIRNIYNLPIHFILVVLRYTSPLILTINLNPEDFFYIILVFPLVNLIERASEKRFNINFLIKRRNKIRNLRIFYYFIILLIFITLDILNYNIPSYIIIASFYMLLYRILSPIIINKTK